MPEYKLTYFNIRGRGEAIRMMLAYAGKTFQEITIEMQDWPKLKHTMPLGILPVLEVDGGKVTIVQSLAITRYIARETGLAGADSLEQAQVDMIAETASDIMLKGIQPLFFVTDPVKKAEHMKAFEDGDLKQILTFFEKTLANNSCHSGFFVGKNITLADFIAWHMIGYPITYNDKCLDNYPKLKANREKVSSIPKFAEYIEKQRKTEF